MLIKNCYKLLVVLLGMTLYFNVSGQKLSGTYYIPSGIYKSLTCDSTGETGSPGIFRQ